MMKRIRIVEFRGEKYREIKSPRMACLHCPYYMKSVGYLCQMAPSPNKDYRNLRDYCALEVPNNYVPLREKEKKLGNKS